MDRLARPPATGRDKTKSYSSGLEPLVITYKGNTMILTYGVALESREGLQWKAGAYRLLSIYTNKIAAANKSRTVH